MKIAISAIALLKYCKCSVDDLIILMNKSMKISDGSDDNKLADVSVHCNSTESNLPVESNLPAESDLHVEDKDSLTSMTLEESNLLAESNLPVEDKDSLISNAIKEEKECIAKYFEFLAKEEKENPSYPNEIGCKTRDEVLKDVASFEKIIERGFEMVLEREKIQSRLAQLLKA